jgi:hypothetical protein
MAVNINVGKVKAFRGKQIEDLKRLDESVFELSDGLRNMLEKNYSNPIFGFIICKLAEGNENYHPFAYSHDITGGKVFIPTRHYHDESNQQNFLVSNDFYNNFDVPQKPLYDTSNINNSPMFDTWGKSTKSTKNEAYKSNKIDYNLENEADDWDHDIFLYNVNINTNPQVKNMDESNCKFNKLKLNLDLIDFPLNPNCKVFTKLEINGRNPNTDIVLGVI